MVDRFLQQLIYSRKIRLKRKLSIETLMQEFKPVALEIYEFEYRTKSSAFFCDFGL